MRIALISDIHSNAPALLSVLSDIDNRRVDSIFCAGDLVGYYAFPNKVVSEVKANEMECVRGNHDEAVITETPSDFNIRAKRAADWTRRNLSEQGHQFLRGLKSEYRERLDGVDVYMTHGSPVDPINEYVHQEDVTESLLQRWFETPPDVVVLGHTHTPMLVTVGGTSVVNPGSVGQPRDGNPDASYAVFDTDDVSIEFFRVPYDIDETAFETQKELPKRLADRLYEGR